VTVYQRVFHIYSSNEHDISVVPEIQTLAADIAKASGIEMSWDIWDDVFVVILQC
jgi:hypothetical protein